MAHRAKSALGGGKKKPDHKKPSGGEKKRKVHRMHLSRLHSGHFLAEHEFEPGMSPMEPERHAIEASELGNHVAEHMGAGEEPEPEPAPGVNPGAIPQLRPM